MLRKIQGITRTFLHREPKVANPELQNPDEGDVMAEMENPNEGTANVGVQNPNQEAVMGVNGDLEDVTKSEDSEEYEHKCDHKKYEAINDFPEKGGKERYEGCNCSLL